MPFKSEAQRRKFWAMVGRGEMKRSVAEEWESATPKDKKLPEHVKKAFVSELQKIGRSYAEDILGGIDPTGTMTYGLGVADAAKAKSEQRKRQLAAGLSGLVGGALAIPVIGSGVVGGAKGFTSGGWRGIPRGFAQGVMSPIRGLREFITAKSMTPEKRREAILGGAVALGSGLLSGGGAALQYGAGADIGKLLTPEQRQLVREGKVG